MERLAPKCPQCGRATLGADATAIDMAALRIATAHGGDTICVRCGARVRLGRETEWVALE